MAKTDVKKQKRKVLRKMLRKTMVLGLSPIMIIGCIILIFCGVCEAREDYLQGENAAQSEAGPTPEEEYDEFVFQAANGPVQSAVAWISFYTFGLCDTGWPVKVAYHFTTAVIWVLVAAVLLIIWISKIFSASEYIAQGRDRFKLSHWQLIDIQKRSKMHMADFVFIVLLTLLLLFQFGFMAIFKHVMTPVAILMAAFMLFEVIRQLRMYFESKADDKATRVETKLKPASELSEELRRQINEL